MVGAVPGSNMDSRLRGNDSLDSDASAFKE